MNEYEIEEYILEQARERDRKKRQNKCIPDKIEIFSVNDMW